MAEVCRRLTGPGCGAAYAVQIERVLRHFLPAWQLGGLAGGEPGGVVDAYRTEKLIPPRLVGECAALPAAGGQAVPREQALAVCFAASFYPRRAFALEDAELKSSVQAFWDVYQALGAASQAALPAAAQVLGAMSGRLIGIPPDQPAAALWDLGSAEHVAAPDPQREQDLRYSGAALYLACCPRTWIEATFGCWGEEAPLLRLLRECAPEPPSELAQAAYSGGRVPDWRSVRARLDHLLPGFPPELRERLVTLERAAWNEALCWVDVNVALGKIGDFWGKTWERLISGFPYYAFLSRFPQWWKQCLKHYRFSAEDVPLSPEEEARPEPSDSAAGLSPEDWRLFREGYRLIRTSFFLMRQDVAQRQWPDAVEAHEALRAALDDLWYLRLEQELGADPSPEMVKTIEKRHGGVLGPATVNNLNHRLHRRLWAYGLARTERWRNSQIRSARRPSAADTSGGEYVLRNEKGWEAVASLARLVRPRHTLLWAFTAHVFLYALVAPQRRDPWSFRRWVRELWRWVSDPAFWDALRRGANDGNRADGEALKALRQAPFKELIPELAAIRDEGELEGWLLGPKLARFEQAVWPLVQETVGSGLRVCAPAEMARWRKMAAPHWVVPVWYVTFVEQVEPGSVPGRLLVDEGEAEKVVKLAQAMRARAAVPAAGRTL